MDKINKAYFVERTCSLQDQPTRALMEYRHASAYVLLGDPGAGKTEAFIKEAAESGGEYIKARDFATFEINPQLQGKTLFIDGLDEMRAEGSSRTPLDQIRKHLDQLGKPRFRLSCREADWLGDSDIDALKRVSPEGEVIALHLDPLTGENVSGILLHKGIDAVGFIDQAHHHGLNDLLRNPQTLNLLVEAVRNKEWPQNRKDVYEMASYKLVRELNSEHRLAKRNVAISDETQFDTAGYLCAIQLLSGSAGFALDDDVTSEQYIDLKSLANPGDLPLMEALKTKLFQGDDDHRRMPIHRSVAEYLGAAYIAKLIENRKLSISRVLALMTGEDGGIVTDLRGLSAWLSVHCVTGRARLIESDPLGVVLYGDVKSFPPEDKKHILDSMHGEAIRYPWFRSDDWASSPFGALGTLDMEPTFSKILLSPSRIDADQALLDCVLDAMQYGEPMPKLASALNTIVRDVSYWPMIRAQALRVLIHVTSDDHAYALSIVEDVRAGVIEDREDELLGMLLGKFYPGVISVDNILDFLHPPKARNLIGTYFMFWNSKLLAATPVGDLPTLLDQLVLHSGSITPLLREQQLYRMVGEVLVSGLMTHGDTVTDERLYDWLGVGLDQYAHSHLELDDKKNVAQWLEERPERYKSMIEYGIALYAGRERHLYQLESRLYGSTPPLDIGSWYLEKATTEQKTELAEYFFRQAVHRLIQEGGQAYLIPVALEFLDTWLNAHTNFRPLLAPFITCDINGLQQELAISDRDDKLNQEKSKHTRLSYFRDHLVAINDGSAPPTILSYLAQVYKGVSREAHGETPQDRLADFLDGDQELISAAYAGLRHTLDRNNLPSVVEIIEIARTGQMHLICWPCLVGMDELYQADPTAALKLGDTVLSRLLAFRLTDKRGGDPAWFAALLQKHPALVADVMLAYAVSMLGAKKEHVGILYALAYDNTYADVARIALPNLLEKFPLRAGKNQISNALDPLIKGSLRYLNHQMLTQVVARKLASKSVDAAQRVYWLACGLVIAPEIYAAELMRYLGKNQVRRNYLANFFHSRRENWMPNVGSFPESTLALLIELFAADCSPERPTGAYLISPAMETAELVRTMISTLGNSSSEVAKHELQRLLALPTLSIWHSQFQGALHSQRIARRKATFNRVGSTEVSRALANLQPASSADFAALVFDHLCDIAKNIRHGNTNDYKQYWSHDASNNKLSLSKPENDCRDALLSDLKIHLGKAKIEVVKEGYYAEDKRADIRASFGGVNGFNLPIEIKKDNHANLWTAINKQLVAQYVRDPGTGGFGIYLVLWFGGKGMSLPPNGKKPRNAKELEEHLRSTLTPEDKHYIKICVVDCALPLN